MASTVSRPGLFADFTEMEFIRVPKVTRAAFPFSLTFRGPLIVLDWGTICVWRDVRILAAATKAVVAAFVWSWVVEDAVTGRLQALPRLELPWVSALILVILIFWDWDAKQHVEFFEVDARVLLPYLVCLLDHTRNVCRRKRQVQCAEQSS